MNAPARLSVYGAGLAAVFAAAYLAAGAVIPEHVVTDWTESTVVEQHTTPEH